VKFLVWVRAWSPGEFERLYEEEKAKNPLVRFQDQVFEKLYQARYRERIFEAESSEKAIEQAKEWAPTVGLPPASDWSETSSVGSAPLLFTTIRELLASTPLHSWFDDFRAWEFALEAEVKEWGISDALEKEHRVRTDYFGHKNYDGERGWTLGAVYFDGDPVFVFQKAGRDGRDYQNFYLISFERREALITYLRTLVSGDDRTKEFGLDEEIPGLTAFYNDTLAD
jgi:hypothetical protein